METSKFMETSKLIPGKSYRVSADTYGRNPGFRVDFSKLMYVRDEKITSENWHVFIGLPNNSLERIRIKSESTKYLKGDYLHSDKTEGGRIEKSNKERVEEGLTKVTEFLTEAHNIVQNRNDCFAIKLKSSIEQALK